MLAWAPIVLISHPISRLPAANEVMSLSATDWESIALSQYDLGPWGFTLIFLTLLYNRRDSLEVNGAMPVPARAELSLLFLIFTCNRQC